MASSSTWLLRPRLKRALRASHLPWAVLGAGLLLTLVVCSVHWRLQQREHTRLERALADDISVALTNRLNTHLAILDAVVGLFNAGDGIHAEAFGRFYASLDVRHRHLSGIQGVGFAVLVPPGGTAALEEEMQQQGQPDFRVRPIGPRSLTTAIVFLQPQNWRNERAMGFDMASEATRREAMAQAVRTGETVLSGPLRLMQETSDNPQVGTLLYAPVYRQSTAPLTSEQARWRQLRGWVFSPLRMGDLLGDALRSVQNPERAGAHLVVYDGLQPVDRRLLYNIRGVGPGETLDHPTWVQLTIGSRDWLIGVELDSVGRRGLGLDPNLLLIALLGGSLSALAALVTDRLVANHLSLRLALEREGQAAGERALAAAVFDTSPVGIVVTDPDGIILHVNQAFTQISGFSELEARGHKTNLLRSGRHDDAFYRQMWEAIVQRGHWSGEIWNRHRTGQIRRHELNITAVLNSQRQIVHFVGLLRDITQRYSQDRRMRHMATHDPLTGLANRSLLMEELERCLSRARRQGEGVALLFLDLNGFKAVNDSRGHSCGDALLQAVAQRLRRQVRASDLLSRQGGDEFVLLISDAPDCEQLQAVAAKLLESLDAPYPEVGDGLKISASVGIARWPDHASNGDGLLDAADSAMYVAKQSRQDGRSIAVATPLMAGCPSA
ncbi:MAG: CHASE domain-containing protein [Cyanobium sp.]